MKLMFKNILKETYEFVLEENKNAEYPLDLELLTWIDKRKLKHIEFEDFFRENYSKNFNDIIYKLPSFSWGSPPKLNVDEEKHKNEYTLKMTYFLLDVLEKNKLNAKTNNDLSDIENLAESLIQQRIIYSILKNKGEKEFLNFLERVINLTVKGNSDYFFHNLDINSIGKNFRKIFIYEYYLNKKIDPKAHNICSFNSNKNSFDNLKDSMSFKYVLGVFEKITFFNPIRENIEGIEDLKYQVAVQLYSKQVITEIEEIVEFIKESSDKIKKKYYFEKIRDALFNEVNVEKKELFEINRNVLKVNMLPLVFSCFTTREKEKLINFLEEYSIQDFFIKTFKNEILCFNDKVTMSIDISLEHKTDNNKDYSELKQSILKEIMIDIKDILDINFESVDNNISIENRNSKIKAIILRDKFEKQDLERSLEDKPTRLKNKI